MIAIVSDIHANIDALEAVLADIDRTGADEIVCLGDVIGYGPDPVACFERFKNEIDGGMVLMGNHEEALVQGTAQSFTSRARRAVEWTRRQLLGPEDEPLPEAQERLGLFTAMPTVMNRNGIAYVHGSLRSHTREYVTPRDARNMKKMEALFEQVEHMCFFGHTHLPGVFTEEEGFSSPADLMNIYILGNEKALVNVGSVGQPRDGNPRACYVTFDGESLIFRRVEYDYSHTAAKIYNIPELDNSLGDRLKEGR